MATRDRRGVEGVAKLCCCCSQTALLAPACSAKSLLQNVLVCYGKIKSQNIASVGDFDIKLIILLLISDCTDSHR